MSEKLWDEFIQFWDEDEIKEKAERYQELYENPEEIDNDFSWVNKKEKLNKISKAAMWGIPNHILGDIDNSKFIIGLFNPGTHMNKTTSEECSTVGEYIQSEVSLEKNIVDGVEFDSKEVYETNDVEISMLHDFYYNHILSKENVISQELKKLYKIYCENEQEFKLYLQSGHSKRFKAVAYYLGQYYSHVFHGSGPGYVRCMKHYSSIFEKMNKAKRYDSGVEHKFEEALIKLKITNIELIPYRTSESNDIGFSKKQESSILSAKVILEKLLTDKESIVILRSRGKWEGLFKKECASKDVNYSQEIEPRLFELGTSGAISYKNLYPVKKKKNNSKLKNEDLSERYKQEINKIVDELSEEIRLKEFEEYLDNVIAMYH